jgi:alkylation response protein AidB-like acyl-CoA dehydrogenase
LSEARPDVATLLVEQIARAPDRDRLAALNPVFAELGPDGAAGIIAEAGKFAARHLAPLNGVADREGCLLAHGRVTTPAGFPAAWRAFVEAGWPTLDLPAGHGGQGLPLLLSVAVQQVLDGACMAFGMLPVLQRSAARLILAWGDGQLQREWVPRLVSGEWAATICVSEPDAGSDLGRLRTRARRQADGTWAITGEKVWISFGDHDLTDRIGHCVLARTESGLSLFLVPTVVAGADGGERRNGVVVRRIEAKMGLHGSPTCALGFEDAVGWLVGTEGRGLAQMFVMIRNMRLSAGVQGLAGAAVSTDIAFRYARERRQGGAPHEAAVPIIRHADIRRSLMEMASRVEVVRGLANAAAVQIELSQLETDPAARDAASALSQWLLPIVKTWGAQAGFDSADGAIQVLGGAGYTAEWPVEQTLRDTRVLTIYEGTTGIQALDLLHRRLWREGGAGMRAFLSKAAGDPACRGAHREKMVVCLALLEDAAEHLARLQATPRQAETGATAFLQLAGVVATGWIAARLASEEGSSAAGRWLAACGRYWLASLATRATALHRDVVEAREACAMLDGVFGQV